jgi:hypothetical protein
MTRAVAAIGAPSLPHPLHPQLFPYLVHFILHASPTPKLHIEDMSDQIVGSCSTSRTCPIKSWAAATATCTGGVRLSVPIALPSESTSAVAVGCESMVGDKGITQISEESRSFYEVQSDGVEEDDGTYALQVLHLQVSPDAQPSPDLCAAPPLTLFCQV